MGRRSISTDIKRRIIELRDSDNLAWFEISAVLSPDDPLITAGGCGQIYRREMLRRLSPPKPKPQPKPPKPKPKKPKADPRRRIPEQDRQLILKLHAEGLDWKEIADQIDDPLTDSVCCRSFITKRAKRLLKPKPKRRPPAEPMKFVRRIVQGGCRCCPGLVSFVLFDKSNRQEMREDILSKVGTCDTCCTMYQFEEVMDLQSVIAPYQRVKDSYDSYVGMRLGRMAKQVR